MWLRLNSLGQLATVRDSYGFCIALQSQKSGWYSRLSVFQRHLDNALNFIFNCQSALKPRGSWTKWSFDPFQLKYPILHLVFFLYFLLDRLLQCYYYHYICIYTPVEVSRKTAIDSLSGIHIIWDISFKMCFAPTVWSIHRCSQALKLINLLHNKKSLVSTKNF